MKKNLNLLLSLVMILSLAIAGTAIGFADGPTHGTPQELSNLDTPGDGPGVIGADDGSDGETAVYLETAIDITGTIEPLEINVTHPITLQWAINPNNVGAEFVAPNWTITNNSRVKLDLEVKKLAVYTNGWTDVAKSEIEDWATLDADDSQSKIAIRVLRAVGGLEYQASETAAKEFGSIDADDGVATLSFAASHGLAIEKTQVVEHELELLFTLN